MRIVDSWKMEKVIKKILQLIEEEGLNIAEAEELGSYIDRAVKKNNERQEKCKPFAVFDTKNP